MSDSVVSVEYQCEACGEYRALEWPQSGVREFLTHFCSELGAYTVMRGKTPQNGLHGGGENISHKHLRD